MGGGNGLSLSTIDISTVDPGYAGGGAVAPELSDPAAKLTNS